ncbi:protein of unknown function (plasmid) [Caballeronia sp. S22]
MFGLEQTPNYSSEDRPAWSDCRVVIRLRVINRWEKGPSSKIGKIAKLDQFDILIYRLDIFYFHEGAANLSNAILLDRCPDL